MVSIFLFHNIPGCSGKEGEKRCWWLSLRSGMEGKLAGQSLIIAAAKPGNSAIIAITSAHYQDIIRHGVSFTSSENTKRKRISRLNCCIAALPFRTFLKKKNFLRQFHKLSDALRLHAAIISNCFQKIDKFFFCFTIWSQTK